MTRIERLFNIVRDGLLPQSECRRRSIAGVEIGYPHLKDRRSKTVVPCHPGGTLSDYVPFYFAPRSPMLFAISSGQLGPEAAHTERIIYLVSSIQNLRTHGLSVVVSDRHPAMSFAKFTTNDVDLDRDDFVDWPLMGQRYWNSTPEEPDRKERRQAECLVHPHVPWPLFDAVVTKTDEIAIAVHAVLASVDAHTAVAVRRDWYF
ncbi:type II toxin-antitoxin system toxin DNA ADP-ribosyl transferase DarT [Granulicoccus sp. GXG6511]|uniref:type II toxin-antitoxin system toxin DNA ADP-ribosyl transferase DarT n=1 Tax=Granulicoccus sp. GXG6511 TaxID=3381351 RepID=UPI003D7D12EE